ncbi:hypothetical protein HZB88_05065, partial [archaeon]|nr:hypothetical protein [archaeon]
MKKSQISLFLIAGLAVIIVLSVVLSNLMVGSSLKKSNMNLINSDRQSLEENMKDCLKQNTIRAKTVYGLEDEIGISEYINKNFDSCIYWDTLIERGYEFDKGEIRIDVKTSKSSIDVIFDYPIEAWLDRDAEFTAGKVRYSLEMSKTYFVDGEEQNSFSSDGLFLVKFKKGQNFFDSRFNKIEGKDIKIDIVNEADKEIIGKVSYDSRIDDHEKIYFDSPVDVSVKYDDSLVKGDEKHVRVGVYNEELETWIDITTKVDSVNNIIYGKTRHFSKFAPLQSQPSVDMNVLVIAFDPLSPEGIPLSQYQSWSNPYLLSIDAVEKLQQLSSGIDGAGEYVKLNLVFMNEQKQISGAYSALNSFPTQANSNIFDFQSYQDCINFQAPSSPYNICISKCNSQCDITFPPLPDNIPKCRDPRSPEIQASLDACRENCKTACSGEEKVEVASACDGATQIDYVKYLSDYNICQTGITEVWLWGAPWFGFFESAMAGDGAFFINGGPIPYSCQNKISIMGFNYERTVSEMLHDYSHRFEEVMAYSLMESYGENAKDTEWDYYDGQTFRYCIEHGNCHYGGDPTNTCLDLFNFPLEVPWVHCG